MAAYCLPQQHFQAALGGAVHSYRTQSADDVKTTKDGPDACDSYIAHAPTRPNQQVLSREILMATSQLTGQRNGADHQVDARPTRSTGTVTVLVRGQQVTIDCPPWCTHPHTEVYRSLEDVWHEGREVSLALPGSSEQVVGAQISSWPFAGDPNTASAYMSVFLQGADYLEFTPAQAIAFADQMMACAEDIRAMAEAISGGVR